MANIKYRKSDGTYETITNYNVQPLVPVQETGDSVIDVMSQKAVTDAINNITVEAGQNIDVKDKVISAKGYLYNENDANFYIGDKEENEKIFGLITNNANLTSISEIQNLNLVSELSDTTETPQLLFDNVYWEEGSNIIQHDYNGDGLKGLIVKIKNSTEELIAIILEQDKDNHTVTLDKEIPFNSDGAYVYTDFGAYGKGSVAVSLGSASGLGSFASGLSTFASGIESHSEGAMTYAWGDFSHVEGVGNVSEGQASHSEGFVTRTIGQFSHAEGDTTLASGVFSHAEGSNVISYGDISHAEGYGQEVLGFSATITGNKLTIDTPNLSIGVTDTTLLSFEKNSVRYIFKVLSKDGDIYTIDQDMGEYSGNVCIYAGISYGDYSHAEGTSTSYGSGSHSEGFLTVASGEYSHAEGNLTVASGDYSHAEGYGALTTNSFEHALGQYNKSNEQTLHSIGIGSSATRRNAQEVMLNGDFYVYGIGNYDGTNPTGSQTLQTVINNNLDIVNTRTYTLDFGTSSDLIQDINMIGNITINNIQTYNVNKLFITYGNVVHSEITNFTDMGLSIDKNSRIIWEIERINDEELACVGIESKINN